MNAMPDLPHKLDRTIVIRARRDLVFSFFTDSSRWASWWGQGSTVDPKPGGRVYIRHPNGIEASGQMVELVRPERVVFTYGFESGKPMPPGASLVTIRLDVHDQGTYLQLTHEFAEAMPRDEHVQGWRFQLSLFTNVVLNILGAGANDKVDTWFRAWAEPNEKTRMTSLSSIATDDVRFGDRFSWLQGLNDLSPHITAAQRFMPGMRIERRGDVRQCLGTLLTDWVALGADGKEQGKGTNVFTLDADGKIQSVTGFWG